MTTWLRWVAVLAWLVVVGLAWRSGVLGTGAAVLWSAASLSVFLLPSPGGRRRKGALQYIEMCKQPVGSP